MRSQNNQWQVSGRRISSTQSKGKDSRYHDCRTKRPRPDPPALNWGTWIRRAFDTMGQQSAPSTVSARTSRFDQRAAISVTCGHGHCIAGGLSRPASTRCEMLSSRRPPSDHCPSQRTARRANAQLVALHNVSNGASYSRSPADTPRGLGARSRSGAESRPSCAVHARASFSTGPTIPVRYDHTRPASKICADAVPHRYCSGKRPGRKVARFDRDRPHQRQD